VEQGTARDHLDLKGFFHPRLSHMLWGCNYPAIKISNLDSPPSLMRCSAHPLPLCSASYTACRQRALFHRDRRLFHGFVVGMLFGLEFVCIYVGMFYTDAARAGILINTSPLSWCGAYLFLKERLGLLRIIGLVLAL